MRGNLKLIAQVIGLAAATMCGCEKAPTQRVAPVASSVTADTPVPFGYKTMWIAVRECDGNELARELKLSKVERVSWRDGMSKREKEGGVFVSPPVSGWTLAIGEMPSADQKEWRPLLESLSKRFGDVYSFGTHRGVEYHAWAHAHNGEFVRAYGYLGERGEEFLDVGARTAAEVALGIGGSKKNPDEEDVLAIAAKWTVDTRTLDTQPAATMNGWFGFRQR